MFIHLFVEYLQTLSAAQTVRVELFDARTSDLQSDVSQPVECVPPVGLGGLVNNNSAPQNFPAV